MPCLLPYFELMAKKTRDTLRELLESEPTSWHRDDLAHRFSHYALDSLIKQGTAVRILPAIYAARKWRVSHPARLSAVSLWAHNGVAVTGLAGARLWRLSDQLPSRIDVICRQPLHVTGPAWMRIHTTTIPGQSFIVGGVRVQDPEDVVLRTWNTLDPDDAVGFLIDAIRSGHVAAGKLIARQHQYPRLKRRRALIDLLALMERGIDSYLEYLAATTVFDNPEFADFERQVRISAGGQRYILDMLDKATKVAVELDSSAHHSSDAARRYDIERDANVASMGILTLRFTYEDITRRAEWCRDKVRRTVASRRVAL